MSKRTDIFTPAKRSAVMAQVRGSNTKPELLVRSVLTEIGIRYRLHRKDLPGRPDIAIGRLKLALLVNGCFWHGHHCQKGLKLPQNNAEFWRTKLTRNVERDQRNFRQIETLGWQPVVLWECQLKQYSQVKMMLARLIDEKQTAIRHA